MSIGLETLSGIRIASPCNADWNAMVGDDTVRFCGQCEQKVYNLSTLSSEQAIALFAAQEGAPCVRFFKRADGALLTADGPDAAVRRTGRRRWAAALAGYVGVLAGARYAYEQIKKESCETPKFEHVMGKMAPFPTQADETPRMDFAKRRNTVRTLCRE